VLTVTRTSADISVTRESTVSDKRVMTILTGDPHTQQVLAIGHGSVVIPGLADPLTGTALRGDSAGLGWSNWLVRGRWFGAAPGEILLPKAVLDEARLDVGSHFDGLVSGHPLRFHVVGEIVTSGRTATLDWSTLTAAEPNAEPDEYIVQVRPGSDTDGYAAAVQAQEPDFLTVYVNPTASNSTGDIMNAIMRMLALVLGLVAAVGVFSTMLLYVRERSRDIAILKAVGMSPNQLMIMVMTSSAVLGLIGGLVGLPAGVLTYHWLMTALGHQMGNNPPPMLFNVLHPNTLYPLGLTGLAIAIAGAFLPVRRAARNRVAEILRSE
jgi:putative ABC transport system permease protein